MIATGGTWIYCKGLLRQCWVAFVQDSKCFQGVYFSTFVCLMSLISLLQNLEYISACFCCFFVGIQCKHILSIVIDEVYCGPATDINSPFMRRVLVLHCLVHVPQWDLTPRSNGSAHFSPLCRICQSFLLSLHLSLSLSLTWSSASDTWSCYAVIFSSLRAERHLSGSSS